MDWNFIKQFHLNPPTIVLKRNLIIEEQYKSDFKKNYEHDLYNIIFGKVETNWVLTPNKYPYDFKDKTQHYLIWFKGDVDYDLLEYILSDIQCAYFENIESNKSIKSIRHIHLFIPNISYLK
tara:strand:+ start:224 stop:589 length:366 start_codon:yes stop_codon:yes gene_type:complete